MEQSNNSRPGNDPTQGESPFSNPYLKPYKPQPAADAEAETKATEAQNAPRPANANYNPYLVNPTSPPPAAADKDNPWGNPSAAAADKDNPWGSNPYSGGAVVTPPVTEPYPPSNPANPYGNNPYAPSNSYQTGPAEEAFGRPRPTAQPAYRPEVQQRVIQGMRLDTKPFWTYVMLGIIALFFVAQTALGGALLGQGGSLFSGSIDPVMQWGASIKDKVQAGEWWRLITPIFLHFGLLHVLFNSIALLIFGSQLERLMGRGRFLAIFFVTGIGGNVLTLATQGDRNVIAAGASGAIFGLLGALIGFFYRNRVAMGAWGRANLQNLLFNAGLNAFITISIPGVGVFAHLGGFATGLALGYFLSPLQVRQTIGAGAQSLAVRVRDLAAEWWVVPALLVVEIVLLVVTLQSPAVPVNPFR